MSGLKTIRRRITSVKNTKQITRAMKLVSAAKLRRAQEGAVQGRAFAGRLSGLLAQVIRDLPAGYINPLCVPREKVKTRAVVVFTGDRGLCGAFNTNVIKAVLAQEKNNETGEDIQREFVLIGRRAVQAAKRFQWAVAETHEGLPEDASKWPAKDIGDSLVSGFISGRFDEVVVYYTKFVSTMTQIVEREVLLPFSVETLAGSEQVAERKVTYDPQPMAVIQRLIPLFLKTQLCQSGLESKASEHASRMTAMDSATRNADELIDKLRLFYNRARQTAITRELIDIVGGAEAQK